MSRSKDTMVSKFDRFRAEYDRSRENRYTRKRDGLAYRGASADWHYRNEYLYYRDIEVSRQLDMDDAAISAGTTLAVNNIIQDGFMPNPATGDKAVDDELWNRFWDWAEDPEQCDESGESTFHEMEVFVTRALLRNGDITATANPSGKLSLWEAHEVQTENANADDGVRYHDGRKPPANSLPYSGGCDRTAHATLAECASAGVFA
jgi:hypothetical protein